MNTNKQPRDSTESTLQKIEALGMLCGWTDSLDRYPKSPMSPPMGPTPPLPARNPRRDGIAMNIRRAIPDEWTEAASDGVDGMRHRTTGSFPSYNPSEDPFARPASQSSRSEEVMDSDSNLSEDLDATPTQSRIDLRIPAPRSPVKAGTKYKEPPYVAHNASSLSLASETTGLGLFTPEGTTIGEQILEQPHLGSTTSLSPLLTHSCSAKKPTGLRKARSSEVEAHAKTAAWVDQSTSDENQSHFQQEAVYHDIASRYDVRLSKGEFAFPVSRNMEVWRFSHPHRQAHNEVHTRLEILYRKAARWALPPTPELQDFRFQQSQMKQLAPRGASVSGSGQGVTSPTVLDFDANGIASPRAAEAPFGSLRSNRSKLSIQGSPPSSPSFLKRADRSDTFNSVASNARYSSPQREVEGTQRRKNSLKDDDVVSRARHNAFSDQTARISRREIASAVLQEYNEKAGIASDGRYKNDFGILLRQDISRSENKWKRDGEISRDREKTRYALLNSDIVLDLETRKRLRGKLNAASTEESHDHRDSFLLLAHYQCAWALRWLEWAEKWEQAEIDAINKRWSEEQAAWFKQVDEMDVKESERKRRAYELSLSQTKESRQRRLEQERVRDAAIKAADEGQQVALGEDARMMMTMRDKRQSVMSTLALRLPQLRHTQATEGIQVEEVIRNKTEEEEVAARKRAESDAEKEAMQAEMKARREKVIAAMSRESQGSHTSTSESGSETSSTAGQRKSQAVADYYQRRASKASSMTWPKGKPSKIRGDLEAILNGTYKSSDKTPAQDQSKPTIWPFRNSNSSQSPTGSKLSSDSRTAKLRQTVSHHTMSALPIEPAPMFGPHPAVRPLLPSVRSDTSLRSSDDSFERWKSERDKLGRLLEVPSPEMGMSPQFKPQLYESSPRGETKDEWVSELKKLERKAKRNAIFVERKEGEVDEGEDGERGVSPTETVRRLGDEG